MSDFYSLVNDLNEQAGFTLSWALFRKKCGALQLRRQTLYFSWKKMATLFLVITVRVSAVSSPQKLATAPFVGPFFVGPVWPNMLNMPKSAAVNE